MVGGMGHSSALSLGVSTKTKHEVICLDGDGSFLMHLGSIVSIKKVGKTLNTCFLIIFHMNLLEDNLQILIK